MFTGNFFPATYFAPRYFPRNGAAAAGGGTLPRVSRTTTADMFRKIEKPRPRLDLLREDEEIIIL